MSQPITTVRVLIETVAVSQNPEATIRYAKARATDWGYDDSWEPTIAEAVAEIVLGGGTPADGCVEIVNIGHCVSDDQDDAEDLQAESERAYLATQHTLSDGEE